MTPQQIVGVAIRMFSVWLAITSIPYLSSIPTALLYQEKNDSAVVSVIVGCFYLATALVIWLLPMAISHKLVPKSAFENRFNTRPDEVATVGIAILGLWKVVDAGPDLVSYLFQTHLNAGNRSILDSLGPSGKADVLFILIELLIASLFLLKAHQIAKFITKPFSGNARNDL